MKKTICCLLVMLMLFCSIPLSFAEERTVVDMAGKTITLPDRIENYCILYSSATPFLAMLDEDFAHVRMIPNGYEDWLHRFYPNLPEQALVINKRTVTAEAIVENGTQVVFVSDSTNSDVVEALELVGIPCVNVTISNTDDMLRAIRLIAEVLDTDYAYQKAELYADYYAKVVTECTTRASAIPSDERYRMLMLSNYDALTAYGVNMFMYAWGTAVGFDYIVPSQDGADKVELTMEQVYEFDPDIVIFAAYKNSLAEAYATPQWMALRAGAEGKLYTAPICLDVWAMANTQCVLLYEWALVEFYPEYAEGIDLKKDTYEFYKTFYGYELTDNEVEAVLEGNRLYLQQ